MKLQGLNNQQKNINNQQKIINNYESNKNNLNTARPEYNYKLKENKLNKNNSVNNLPQYQNINPLPFPFNPYGNIHNSLDPNLVVAQNYVQMYQMKIMEDVLRMKS